jgi:acyl-CoA reductase-like NAD-dependent aldehyde dehydrogenase
VSATAAPSPNLIGSRRIVAGLGEIIRRNPADTREVVGVFPVVATEEVQAAIEAAAEAQPEWAAIGAPARGEVLYRAAELLHEQAPELAELITREEGKAYSDALTEVMRAVATLRFYGSCGRLIAGATLPSSRPQTQIYTERFPLGVVALITPWNFPLAIPCQKAAPALVAGNAVVLKPSSLTPSVALRLSEALLQAGVPAGVINLVTTTGSIAGSVFAADPRVAAISFTGSVAAGSALFKAGADVMRRMQLEMGGKNVCLILADADLDFAARSLARGSFALTGQSCTATGLALVEEQIYDDVVERVAQHSRTLRVGSGLEPTTEIGPAVSEEELDSTLAAVALGQAEGARLVAGGDRLEAPQFRHGYFSRPAVLADATPSMEVAQTEIFGPVAVVSPVSGLEEAIAITNESPLGLTAAIFTQSLRCAREFVRGVEVGIVKVNEPTIGLELHVPFGGMKGSSNDGIKELGTASLDFFTREKSVYLTEDRLDS